MYESRLVWINGPFDASVHDITIFRNPDDPDNSLKNAIPEGKLVVADSGYRGEKQKVATSHASDSKELTTFKNRV